MKFLSGIIFLFISAVTQAQLQDRFDDGDIHTAPIWSGHTLDFMVNSSLQLQLNAGAAGNSWLSTPCNPDMFSELEWRFFIHQNFSPSSGNYGKVYLVSDQQDLSGPLNGYYLQFGESLSDDAVELFRQDGTTSVSVCRATNASIASAFSLSVRVTRDHIGLWSLWIDYSGGTNYVLECYGAEAMYTTSSYFGVFCDYTTGNRTNFYFDDFYAGPLLHDTVPPEISAVMVQSSSSLELQFSETMKAFSANAVSNYFLDAGMGNPVTSTLNSIDPTKVLLEFSNPFVSSFQHTLSISGVEDISGNVILPGVIISFTFYPAVVVETHDVIFTEILFEPSSSGALPNFEFVEIYNRKPDAISLKNWTISDGSTTSILPDIILLPQTYLILCNTSGEVAFSAYGNTQGLSSFPVLNNDVGDHLQLRDNNNYLIEELNFSNQTYRDASKDDGGFTLERIDTSFLCTDVLNWKASMSALGGTPGLISSVTGTYMDYEKPVLLRASLVDSVHLSIFFSEKMDEVNILNPLMYNIVVPGQFSLYPDSVIATDDQFAYLLRLPFIVAEHIYEINTNYGLKDCPGNELDNSQEVRFAIPQVIDSGDVVINEILFNSQSGGSDFVELYNLSNKVLDIFHWRIAEAPYNDFSSVQPNKSISERSHLFFPNEYLTLSVNSSDIRQRYDNPGIRPFLSVSNFPDFNSADGAVIIYDSLGNILDLFNYSEKMHFPLLIEKKGVSLERLSPEMKTDEVSNWHSGSSSSGFATPGYKNSVGWTNAEIQDGLSIDPSVFSPDNDGYNDLLFIRLSQSDKQGIAQILVFDLYGHLIRELSTQAILGDEHLVIWDGLTDNGEVATIGTYIIYAEIFNVNGEVKKKKLACALTMK